MQAHGQVIEKRAKAQLEASVVRASDAAGEACALRRPELSTLSNKALTAGFETTREATNARVNRGLPA